MGSVNIEALRPGDRIDAKYEVQYVLGQGGMGVVVAALHLDLQEIVALKFLLRDAVAQPEAVERFLREARSVRKLQSEHVVKVLDVGRLSDSGLPYMAMELLAGEDLDKAIHQSGPLPIALACDCLIQACDAIAEAHSLGIVHRDIKPANIFALAAPKKGKRVVKVLDFGIAKLLEPDGVGTKTQAVIGSALYMSPEQMRSAKKVDGRTDIWSLGVTLYEMLTGQLPFVGESLPEVVSAVLTDDPVSPRTYRADLPAELDAVILRCLEKKPDARFRTAGELAAALAPFAMSDAFELASNVQHRGSFVDIPSAASGVLVPPAASPSGAVAPPPQRWESGSQPKVVAGPAREPALGSTTAAFGRTELLPEDAIAQRSKKTKTLVTSIAAVGVVVAAAIAVVYSQSGAAPSSAASAGYTSSAQVTSPAASVSAASSVSIPAPTVSASAHPEQSVSTEPSVARAPKAEPNVKPVVAGAPPVAVKPSTIAPPKGRNDDDIR